MRVNLTTFLLLLSLLQVSAASFGQKLTLKAKDISINGVFREIRKQTGYGVVNVRTNLNTSKKIDANFQDVPLATVMEQMLLGTDMTYVIEDKNILLIRKEKLLIDRVMERFQNIDVMGKVIDSDGRPISGANVKIKGTKISVSTNNEGDFLLRGVDENAMLVISYVGYEAKEIKAEKSLGTIKLDASLNPLDEVQVIAYGTTTRRLSTGNVGTVKAEEIERQPVNNPLLALQGRVPGLVVTQNSGVPGGGVTVRIQGQNSIRSGNDPLYVIDGVPILSQLPSTGLGNMILGNSGAASGAALGSPAGNPLSFLNPTDIESIDVLKDADATAIYGSRAANGAILITTKRGKVGKMKFDVNFQSGWGDVPRKLEVLNTRQYLDMRYEAYKNDGINWKTLAAPPTDLVVWDTTRYTDWQKELIGNTAGFQNGNVSISGGSNTNRYLLGVKYDKETSVFPGNNGNIRKSLNFSYSLSSNDQKFKIDFSGNYMHNDNRLPSSDLTQSALFLEPNAPNPLSPDGTLNFAMNSAGNPTFHATNPYIFLFREFKDITSNLISNITASYRIFDELDLRTSAGYTNMRTNQFTSAPTITIAPNFRSTQFNSASYGNRDADSWIIEPQLNYKTKIFSGRLEVLLGMTVIENNSESGYLFGQNYASDALLENINLAQTLTAPSLLISTYRYNAIFARANYSWKDELLLNVVSRRDGSSRFGANNRFSNFGSIGAAWIFSQNSHIRNLMPWLSYGKIRSSYGSTGNDQIGDYQFISRYSSTSSQVPYQSSTALFASNLNNPNIEWERTRKWSFGLELGVFSDRFLLNATYSKNTSDNQLNSYVLPSITGFKSILSNFPGTVQNTSWEFSLNSENLRMGKIRWTTAFNLTIPKNRLIAFPDLQNSTYASTLVVGEPLNIQKTYNFVNVDATTGLYQYKDINGNLTATPNSTKDNYIITDLNPSWYGGLQNQISIGRFQIDIFGQFVKQKAINSYHGNYTFAGPGQFIAGISNQPVTVLDRWQKIGDEKSIQKFSSLANNQTLIYVSNAALEDASYFRLKNISFSWQLPTKWINRLKMENVKLFSHAQNLLTLTRYKGLDPEYRGAAASLPPLRVITLGTQIVF